MIKNLNDLADRLELWGRQNKQEAATLRWRSARRQMLHTLGVEQLNTAHEIREILRGGQPP